MAGHLFKDFLTTKCIDMKTILFFLALFLATARPASAQTVVKTGTVAQVRLDKVNIPGYGRHAMYFVETVVEGKTQLLLLDAECPVRAGAKIKLVEGHDVPRYVLLDGSGRRWYCFMRRYLNR